MQHVVQALVDTRFIQSQHIEWFLDHADHFLVTIRVTTDHTGIGFGDVEAARAIDNALFDAHDRLSQAARLVGWTAQDEERQALRRFDANSRQFRELLDQRRHGWCNVTHTLEHSWDAHASCQAAGHFLLRFRDLVKSGFGSSQDHYLEFGNIFRVKGFGIDFDGSDLKLTAHGDRHCAAASGAGKLACFQFFLHFNESLLHFLDFTHVHGKNSLLTWDRCRQFWL